MTGTDGRKPTPLAHIYFNRPELLQNDKIVFNVHNFNYNDNTKRETNEYKLTSFNSTGQLIWPQGSNAPYCGNFFRVRSVKASHQTIFETSALPKPHPIENILFFILYFFSILFLNGFTLVLKRPVFKYPMMTLL